MTSKRYAVLPRLSVAVLAPLLVAAECNEPSILISQSYFAGRLGVENIGTITVSNRGGVDATLGDVSSAGLGLAPPFAVVPGGTCTSGQTLAKSFGQCTLRVAFTPVELTSYTDTIELQYSWSGGSARTELSELSAGGAPPLAIPIFGPSLFDRPLASTTELTFTLRNESGYAVSLPELSSAGLGLAAPFTRSGGTCASNSALPAGASCTLVIRFVPTTLGAFNDTLAFQYQWVNGNGVESTAQVSLPLAGSSAPPVTLSATPRYLTPTPVGLPISQLLTIRNGGGSAATLGTLNDAALGLAAPFSLAGGSCTSGLALAAGASCTLEIRFAATAPGSFSDELRASYSWPSSGSFVLSHLVTATAAADGSDCFQTGCAPGSVCSEVTSSETGAGTCVVVPPPPDGCMAPCVWEAQSRCLPVQGACTSERVQVGTTTEDRYTTCDKTTRWAVEQRRNEFIPFYTEYRRAGSACYTQRQGFGSGAYEFTMTDGSQPIAAARLDLSTRERSVWCGPYTSTSGLDPAQAYLEKDPTTPECAAWRSAFLQLTSCRTTSPGSCAGL